MVMQYLWLCLDLKEMFFHKKEGDTLIEKQR